MLAISLAFSSYAFNACAQSVDAALVNRADASSTCWSLLENVCHRIGDACPVTPCMNLGHCERILTFA